MWAYCQMYELNLWSTVITLCIVGFIKFYILVTACNHAFNVDMKTAVVISLRMTNLLAL